MTAVAHLDVVLAQGVAGRLFHVRPHDPTRRVPAWPAGLLPTWENHTPALIDCTPTPDGLHAEVRALAPGTAHLTIRADGQASMVTVTIGSPTIDAIEAHEPPR